MFEYAKILMLLPLLVFGYQMYCYITTLEKENRQRACRSIGIVLFTIGVICFAFRDKYYVFIGLVVIMVGLRLMAYGLERKDKTIFIDRYKE